MQKKNTNHDGVCNLISINIISGDQSEISSNCPSRKGSTFSVVNRQSNSITPSTSSHHITVSSRERDLDASSGNNTSKEIDKTFGTNHSLDRGHSTHSHSHTHHHHHHHSLDRDSANFANHSCSATRGQFYNNTNPPPSSSVVAKSRSSTSNNSLTLSNHINSSEEQFDSELNHRKSNSEWNESTGCVRGGSDRSRPMMKPPKDPKSTNHHHHSRHKLNDEHQHQHRKKSIGSVGDDASLGGMRKISAAGSVSSVLSENSVGSSHSKCRVNSSDFSHKMPAN